MSHSECWVIGSAPHPEIKTDSDIIAVKNEITVYSNAKYCLNLDQSWYARGGIEKLKSFKGIRVFILCLHGSVKDGLIVRDETHGFDYDLSNYDMIIKSRKLEGLSRSFKDFRNNANSGLAAFQFALCMGYDVIHLVGLELKGKYSFAYEYLRPELGKVLKQVYPNVRVINHCETSRLKEYLGYEPV